MANKYTQTQQVVDTLRANGGYATLGNLYHLVDTSAWATKTPNESIRRVRDLFVFQSFTGLSYADLAKFNFKRDVVQHEGKYIIYDMRIKTEEDYYIVLLSPALEVLKKYNYELPIISNTQYNLRLKLVADYAGLDKNLTTHMARHTFATLALTKGVQFKAVSKMLGHSSLKTTEEYAAILNKDVDKGYEMFEKQISG